MEPAPEDRPWSEEPPFAEEEDGEPAFAEQHAFSEDALASELSGVEPRSGRVRRVSLSRWVEKRAQGLVSRIYESRADEIEERARRAVGSAYRDQADDLEERAVRAMRRAITDEADKIKAAIEHAIEVKKREVRLSLLVLVAASLLYLTLYWFTGSAAS